MLFPSRQFDQEQITPFQFRPEAFDQIVEGNLEGLNRDGTPVPEATRRSIAELLLESPSTAIMHMPPKGRVWRKGWRSTVMFAVNYHNAHSEGTHRIVVQDPARREDGQYVLWVPPGSGNRTFMRRSFLDAGSSSPYTFEDGPANALKIDGYYLHVGDADEAITSFEEAGYTFSSDFLTRDLSTDSGYEHLWLQSARNRDRWDPSAEN